MTITPQDIQSYIKISNITNGYSDSNMQVICAELLSDESTIVFGWYSKQDGYNISMIIEDEIAIDSHFKTEAGMRDAFNIRKLD